MTIRRSVLPMSKSYYPTDRAGQIDWHNNFAKEFPKVGESLGFSQPEIANAANDSKYAVYILETLGPDIESDPGHAARAVLEGQSQGSYVDLPGGSSAPPARGLEHLAASDRMVIATRRALLSAARGLQDSGKVPALVDRPELCRNARGGDVVAPEERDWLVVYDEAMRAAQGPGRALHAAE